MNDNYTDESVFVPPWRTTPVRSADRTKHVEINPSTAIDQSKTRASLRRILTNTGLFAVLIVALAGGILNIRQRASTIVDASVDMKKAVRGRIDEVHIQKNEFVLLYESSIDPVLTSAQIDTWMVSLPPGERLKKEAGLQTCLVVKDLNTTLTKAKVRPCNQVVKAGEHVIVEYLILHERSARMVAKTIIGEE